MFRDAAVLAMPMCCRGQACELDSSACRSRHAGLSREDRRDCLARLFAVSNACKHEAQAAARPGGVEGFRAALPHWIQAETAGVTAATLDPTPSRVSHGHYLAYWRCVTTANIALGKADFPTAREAFAEAQKHVGHLDDRLRSGSKEVAAESIYIDGVASVKAGQFTQAAEKFEKWLNLFPERRGTHDLRFDSVRANYLACVVLGEVFAGVDSTESLGALARHLRSTNVPLPTWTLYRRVQTVAAAVRFVPANVRSVIDEDSSLWTLFLMFTPLDEADKASGQLRTFTPPRFLDMSPLTSDRHSWPQILDQNLRNAFSVLADYERFRYEVPLEDEKDLAVLERLPTVADGMNTEELLRVVRVYLERRDPRLLPSCDRARALSAEFSGAKRVRRFADDSETHERILECFRFPHVVVVEDIRAAEADRKAPKLVSKYNVTFRRLWNREPRSMEIQTLEPLEKGEYYYMRPTWNTRLGERYPPSREERFGIARAARWVDAFWRGLFSPHKVDAAKFAEWILQFRPSERRFASILFEALDVYDEERVRQEWIEAFRRLPLTARRDVAFIGLGHTAKSGHSQVYFFRQGIAQLPEYQTLYGGREKFIFRDLSEFKNEVGGLPRPSTFVFVDDFIGTGGQASDFINWYFRHAEFSFLTESDVFLMVLSGFKDGINEVEKVLRSRVGKSHSSGVVAARVLEAGDRAFGTRRIWRDAAETERAREWAAEIGQELLATDPARDSDGEPLYDPRQDALGWHDCQALISFPHNIPSDTLPIFWSRGSRRGRPWVPLQRRSD